MRRDTLTSIGATASVTAILTLAACGGGGGDGPVTGEPMPPEDDQGPVVSDPEPVPELVLPLARPAGAQQVPVIRFGDELRVGTMAPPGQDELAPVANHSGASVRYGRLRDGLGAAQLSDYLAADSALTRGSLLRFAEAPVVRYVAGTTVEQIDQIVRAVQLLNANLPSDFQLTVDATSVSAAADAAGNNYDTLAEGQILVEFDRREDWEIQPYVSVRGSRPCHG